MTYETRDGYQRARLYIQCTPIGEPRYGVGTYLQQENGPIRSPVMRDGAELYPWIAKMGWVEVPGIALVYERPEPTEPDPCYLGQTDATLAIYDQEHKEISERYARAETYREQYPMSQLPLVGDHRTTSPGILPIETTTTTRCWWG